jgi:hypothetical protein
MEIVSFGSGPDNGQKLNRLGKIGNPTKLIN